MWWYESLILLYVFAGLAVWTWVIRSYHPRARQRARGQAILRRRQRIVQGIGGGSIVLVALLAEVVGLVDASGVALALAAFVGCAQLLLVLTFNQGRTSGRLY